MHKLDGKVKIGSRVLYNDLEHAKKLALPLTEETHPALTQEHRQAQNLKRLNLSASPVKPYDYPTLTKFL